MSSLSAQDRVSLCSFTFSDGRRCRTPRISNHPHFCFYHAQKEARAFAAQKLGNDLDYFFSGDYLSACDLSTALGRLIPAVIRGDLKPKTAHTVAYLAQTLMQAIHVSQHEYCEAFDTDAWRQAIRNSVNGNHDYLFPPDPQPASQPAETAVNCHSDAEPPINCHSERSEESASSSAPPLSPPQPAQTPVNCLSERSDECPTRSASPESCREESASSSNSSPATRHSSLPRIPATPAAQPVPPAPQPAPATQPFRSWALPPHVRRRLHRT